MFSGLSRTPTGAANIRFFHRTSIVVFVEGRDDRAFWKCIFPKTYYGKTLKFNSMGGKVKLLETAHKMASRKKKSLVALDSDYDELMHDLPAYDFIVKTDRKSVV